MSFWGTPVTIIARPTTPMDNDRSTRETIQQMIAIARICSTQPSIVELLTSLKSSLPASATKTDLLRVIFWWVKNHVQFREDESILAEQLGYTDPVQELLISPVSLLSMPQ